MNLVESLRRINNNLDDALGVALAGMDGIVVEEHKRDGLLDLNAMAAEFSGILKQLEGVARNIQLNGISELCVLADSGMTLVRKINEEYFLLLVISPEGNFGKGRFLLRREVARLEKEL